MAIQFMNPGSNPGSGKLFCFYSFFKIGQTTPSFSLKVCESLQIKFMPKKIYFFLLKKKIKKLYFSNKNLQKLTNKVYTKKSLFFSLKKN